MVLEYSANFEPIRRRDDYSPAGLTHESIHEILCPGVYNQPSGRFFKVGMPLTGTLP